MRTETKKLPKLVVLLGPTASGKTDWSLRLATKHNCEIVHADSRQIYKKMDIGTAKPEQGRWEESSDREIFYVDGVPHHLVDFLDPGNYFTVAQFRDMAIKYIKLARKNNRQPMVVGGTGLYIQALIDNYTIPRIPPNKKLRRSLEEKSHDALVQLLEALDPEALKNIDKNNKRRIIRALEVTILSGETFSSQRERGEPIFDTLKIGIQVEREELYNRINLRVDEMMERGLLDEVINLVKQKYAWELPSMSGVGYRQFRSYLDGQISLNEAVTNLKRDTRRFARRQMTWFRRDPEIHWIEDYERAERLVEEFLNN